MFTGIIQEVGTVQSIQRQGDGIIIQVKSVKLSPELKKGGSVSINGACQSAVTIEKDWFGVYAMAETISRTNFKRMQTGTRVNLELPLTLSDPLGGHLVAGHVDDIGVISSFDPSGASTILKVKFSPENRKYLIEKGSIAIDGISLTVFDIGETEFSISWIPETLENTNFKFRGIGDEVNLEFDLFGKYIENFVSGKKGGLTLDFLSEHGFMR
jgi:riboflavin synthase